MSIILNIDTALETAGVSIARDGVVLSLLTNNKQKDHAVFLHDAVEKIIASTHIRLTDLDAIAVTEGPGSYTGLRVGMATAKGFCFALQKPLITVGTLPAMAHAVLKSVEKSDLFYCPMVDARRLEVYTAVYDHNMETILPPMALVLDETSFAKLLFNKKILFFGNGSLKWKQMVGTPNAEFIDQLDISDAVAELAFEKLRNNKIADLIYTEPLYIKDFFTP